MEKLTLITQDASIPLRDVVFQTLREYIVKGKLKPGERLREISLADQLGVSRTPVREAIHKLEQEGLVDLIPRRGAIVAKMTEKKIRDVLAVRKSLEALAGRLACEHMTPEKLSRLKEVANEFCISLKMDDENRQAQLDEEFHETIYQVANNQLLIQLLQTLREKMYLYRLAYIKDEESHTTLVEEHKKILEGFENANPEAVEICIRQHIHNQELSIIQGLTKAPR